MVYFLLMKKKKERGWSLEKKKVFTKDIYFIFLKTYDLIALEVIRITGYWGVCLQKLFPHERRVG